MHLQLITIRFMIRFCVVGLQDEKNQVLTALVWLDQVKLSADHLFITSGYYYAIYI